MIFHTYSFSRGLSFPSLSLLLKHTHTNTLSHILTLSLSLTHTHSHHEPPCPLLAEFSSRKDSSIFVRAHSGVMSSTRDNACVFKFLSCSVCACHIAVVALCAVDYNYASLCCFLEEREKIWPLGRVSSAIGEHYNAFHLAVNK